MTSREELFRLMDQTKEEDKCRQTNRTGLYHCDLPRGHEGIHEEITGTAWTQGYIKGVAQEPVGRCREMVLNSEELPEVIRNSLICEKPKGHSGKHSCCYEW